MYCDHCVRRRWLCLTSFQGLLSGVREGESAPARSGLKELSALPILLWQVHIVGTLCPSCLTVERYGRGRTQQLLVLLTVFCISTNYSAGNFIVAEICLERKLLDYREVGLLLWRLSWSWAAAFAMGSEAVSLTELKVNLENPVFVKPAEPCENTEPLFVCNIDQVCM